MSLQPPEKVRQLQATLHAKAKRSPDYRFYALYDKIYRPDVLEFAYRCCRSNGGAAGSDGQTFEAIEAYGVGRWLGELAEDSRFAFPTSASSVVVSEVQAARFGCFTIPGCLPA